MSLNTRYCRFFCAVLSAFLFLSISGCSSSEKIDTNTAEGSFQLAEKYEKDERYEEAITYYSDVKNKYPYNSLAITSELRIADVEYKQENYPEAETAYKLFREFHPDHAKIDYVTFRLGMSVYNQLPPTIDRDLNLANTAVEHFTKVIQSYPNSEYLKEAKEYKRKTEQMLADKVDYIAHFYFIREQWLSALGRYEDLIKLHSGFGYDVTSLYGATLSAYKLKEMDKAKAYFKRLLSEYPDSKEVNLARKELADGF